MKPCLEKKIVEVHHDIESYEGEFKVRGCTNAVAAEKQPGRICGTSLPLHCIAEMQLPKLPTYLASQLELAVV